MIDVHDVFFPTEDHFDHDELDYDEEYWSDKDEVSLVEVELVEGPSDAHATLIWMDGWEIKLYSPYHISHGVEIGARQAEEILHEIGGPVEERDWLAYDYVYVE